MASTYNTNLTTKLSMLLLAAYPILEYYSVGLFNYASILGLVLVAVTLFSNVKGFFQSLHKSYYLYWAYTAAQIYLIAGIGGWSDYIPGGINFVIFSLVLMAFVRNFNLDVFYKYMKWIFMFATALFLIQNIIYVATGEKICVFLHLGDSLTTNYDTYQDLVKEETTKGTEGLIERFASIFIEPSHYAQYCVLLLALELFKGNNKSVLFTKFSVVIVAVLFLIQSGAGFMGLGFLAVVKLVYILFITRERKYYFYLAVMLPLFLFGLRQYMNSSAGAYVTQRTEQFDYSDRNATNSGFVRMFYGWYAYGDLDTGGKLVGTSRDYIGSLREGGFFNGATEIMMSFGLIGALLLIWFYVQSCRKQNAHSGALALELLFLSLICSLYIKGLMMIVTAVVAGTRYVESKRSLALR